MFPIDSGGHPIPTPGYFNQNEIQARVEAANAMLEALHRNDVPAYQKAAADFLAHNVGGTLPVWASTIVIQDGSLINTLSVGSTPDAQVNATAHLRTPAPATESGLPGAQAPASSVNYTIGTPLEVGAVSGAAPAESS